METLSHVCMEGAIGERAPWPQGFIPGEHLAIMVTFLLNWEMLLAVSG